MEAYSVETNTHYPSWEALVNAETNGWLAVIILRRGTKRQWLWAEGPFETQQEARRASNRQRYYLKRQQRKHEVPSDLTGQFSVTPSWKPLPRR